MSPVLNSPERDKLPQNWRWQTFLRIWFVQQLLGLSDQAAEEAIIDTSVLQTFVDLIGEQAVPGESDILKFRHVLERTGARHRCKATCILFSDPSVIRSLASVCLCKIGLLSFRASINHTISTIVSLLNRNLVERS